MGRMNLFRWSGVSFFFLFGFSALGHPVAYKGSLVLHTENMADHTRLHSSYSLSHRFSFGLSYERATYRGSDAEFVYPHLSFLVKRWNFPDAQSNIYLTGYGGPRFYEGRSAAFFGWSGQVDYETRRIFLAARSDLKSSQQEIQFRSYSIKGGVAPHLASFEELQTWMLVQVSYRDHLDQRLSIGPVLRFFYQNVFWEIGATFRGDLLVNTMVHF